MAYRTILSVIGIDRFEDDLQAAADICGASNAHLSALVVKLAAPPPLGDYAATMSLAWFEERERDIAELREGVEKARRLLSNTGISFQVDSNYTEFASADYAIGERARYADLTLVGAGLSASPDLRSHAVNGALFNSARPVLLVPKNARANLAPKSVLLAWNSHIEAARAAREALDLMAGADMVHVTLVDPDGLPGRNGEEPGADIATYLVRHGINATVDRLPSAGRRVEEVLNQHALDVAADLLVMGAYGHSRMRERIFGGVTKSMIDAAVVPVLMMH
ncbi:universal stress protein [Sinorhizobium saheli]|jgi:nucleotide-binding universal stress UspA family protein|uniref:Universal stress protein n=1 Tax=Sinorhizobium saheli TaxID=36856 RepID=A0A178Y427_SINSA|nr:universal stress protein [Sinorhizobium saheli]MQW89768.1 universal stress protein [Sinorhizobium saheli]OAP42104.1 universal stress protein [Sinorhizobium saheli]